MLFLEKIEKIISNKKIKLGSDVEIETSLKTIAEIPLKENGNTKLISSENQEFLITKAFYCGVKRGKNTTYCALKNI